MVESGVPGGPGWLVSERFPAKLGPKNLSPQQLGCASALVPRAIARKRRCAEGACAQQFACTKTLFVPTPPSGLAGLAYLAAICLR
jgi:hypothetical protein